MFTKFLTLSLCVLLTALAKQNYYELLGLKHDATDEQLKRAFKKLSRENHPDKHRDNKEEA
jgi:curved DNA-binding protein CbpA